MNCEHCQNRLLAQESPETPELAMHLQDCKLCQRFLARSQQLDRELRILPVPSTADTKALFLERVLNEGLIIRNVPTPLSQPRTVTSRWLESSRVLWKPLLSTAAILMAGVGIWSLIPSKSKPQPEVTGPRLEFVRKVLDHQMALAHASDAKQRLTRMTQLAADLRQEAKGISLAVTSREEMRTLSHLFDQVVNDSILSLAREVKSDPSVLERRRALDLAARELADASREFAMLPAATVAQEYFARMAETARSAQTELYRLSKEG